MWPSISLVGEWALTGLGVLKGGQMEGWRVSGLNLCHHISNSWLDAGCRNCKALIHILQWAMVDARTHVQLSSLTLTF